jgi:hypothetical protein
VTSDEDFEIDARFEDGRHEFLNGNDFTAGRGEVKAQSPPAAARRFAT